MQLFNPRAKISVVLIALLLATLGQTGCTQSDPSPAVKAKPSELADVRDRYMKLVRNNPRFLCADESNIQWLIDTECREIGPVLEAYYEATTLQWRRAGAIRLIVIDEDGVPLAGVKAEMRGVSGSIIPSLEPNVRTSGGMFDGEVIIPWSGSSFAVELDLQKKGYRKTRVSFVECSLNYKNHLFRASHEDLFDGFKLPPATVGGPVRILMRKELMWDPPVVHDDGLIAVSPDLKLWPKSVPSESTALTSSDNPSVFEVETTGTYLMANKDGTVVDLYRAYKGDVMGFLDTKPTDPMAVKVQFRLSTSGRGGRTEAAGEPYKVYFYREAKPISSPAP